MHHLPARKVGRIKWAMYDRPTDKVRGIIETYDAQGELPFLTEQILEAHGLDEGRLVKYVETSRGNIAYAEEVQPV